MVNTLAFLFYSAYWLPLQSHWVTHSPYFFHLLRVSCFINVAKHIDKKILLIFFRKQWKIEPGKWAEKNVACANIHNASECEKRRRDETKGSMNKRDILMLCKMILQFSRIILVFLAKRRVWVEEQYEFFRMEARRAKYMTGWRVILQEVYSDQLLSSSRKYMQSIILKK